MLHGELDTVTQESNDWFKMFMLFYKIACPNNAHYFAHSMSLSDYYWNNNMEKVTGIIFLHIKISSLVQISAILIIYYINSNIFSHFPPVVSRSATNYKVFHIFHICLISFHFYIWFKLFKVFISLKRSYNWSQLDNHPNPFTYSCSFIYTQRNPIQTSKYSWPFGFSH